MTAVLKDQRPSTASLRSPSMMARMCRPFATRMRSFGLSVISLANSTKMVDASTILVEFASEITDNPNDLMRVANGRHILAIMEGDLSEAVEGLWSLSTAVIEAADPLVRSSYLNTLIGVAL